MICEALAAHRIELDALMCEIRLIVGIVAMARAIAIAPFAPDPELHRNLLRLTGDAMELC
jgi:hypothetical protein